jgi:hypothetical protein
MTLVCYFIWCVQDIPKWIGYASAIKNINQAIAPFPLLPLLSMEQRGELWPGGYLQTNAVLSFLSCLFYLLLLPKLSPPKKVGPEEGSPNAIAMKAYKETGDIKWLTAQQLTEVGEEIVEKNKEKAEADKTPMPTGTLTTFEEDKDELDRISSMATADFPYLQSRMRSRIKDWRTGDEEYRQKFRETMAAYKPFTEWEPEHEENLGKWFTDYLQWAGYLRPITPRMYKVWFEQLPFTPCCCKPTD